MIKKEINNKVHGQGRMKKENKTLGTERHESIDTLLNIMFHAPMGRFQLELIYFYYLFFHRRPIQ